MHTFNKSDDVTDKLPAGRFQARVVDDSGDVIVTTLNSDEDSRNEVGSATSPPPEIEYTFPSADFFNGPTFSDNRRNKNSKQPKRKMPQMKMTKMFAGTGTNQYSSVRAHVLTTMGGSDWGSAVSDDLTMTDTMSAASVYTAENLVASYDNEVFTREISGFLNRLNFFVSNYNNLTKANLKTFHHTNSSFSNSVPFMHKVFPLGGHKNDKDFSFFNLENSSIQNSLSAITGWVLALLPIGCHILSAASGNFYLTFSSLYVLATLIVLSVLMLVVDSINKHVFFKCSMCVPVPADNDCLKGLRNHYRDFSEEGIENLKWLKPVDRDYIIQIMHKANSAPHAKETKSTKSGGRKVRLMFYSVEYYQKFVQVPRYKLMGILFLDICCFAITLILCLRKL